MRLAQASDGEFRANGAFMGQKVRQHDSTDFSWHPVGEDTVQPVFRPGTTCFELGHGGHLEKPDGFTHRSALGTDVRHGVEAAVTPDIPRFDTFRRKPQGNLPSVYGAPDSAGSTQPVITGHHFRGASRGPLVAGIVNAEVVAKSLFILVPGVDRVGIGSKTPRIHFAEIDMRLTVNDPVGEL